MSENICCSNISPVVATDYVPKGIYSKVGDTKIYVTGPENASRGLFVVYDIFGYFPQTLQGADIISTVLGIKVVIPDLFDGEPVDINLYPPDTTEKEQKIRTFFATKGKFEPNLERIKTLLPRFKTDYKIEKWAIIGYCWGGKITTLSSQEGTPFVASVQCHPAFLDPKDADKIVTPHLCLASKDENPKHVAEFKAKIESHSNPGVRERSKVNTYEDMFHGWMAARARLEDEKFRKGYEKGYAEVISFLRKTLL